MVKVNVEVCANLAAMEMGIFISRNVGPFCDVYTTEF